MLFKQIVSNEKLNEKYKYLINTYSNYPSREFIKSLFENYNDLDGNFIEQFQSSGFDARLFELYFFGFLHLNNYEIDWNYSSPDFIVSKNGVKVAIELTTVNYSEKVECRVDKHPHCKLENLHDEIAIRFGSSLTSKLKKKYWEREQCKEMPLVIVVEAFYNEESLKYSLTPVVNYLYGNTNSWKYDKKGQLSVQDIKKEFHILGDKQIPSGFFSLPNSEYISAVIVTNSATLAKFKRIGYLRGYNNGDIQITRKGERHNNNPNSIFSKQFYYEVGDPNFYEEMRDGLLVCFNSSAKYPLNKDYFEKCSYVEETDGQIDYYTSEFSVYRSTTKTKEIKFLKNKFERIQNENVHNYVRNYRSNDYIIPTESYFSCDRKKIGIIHFNKKTNKFNSCYFTKEINGEYKFVRASRGYKSAVKAKIKLAYYFEETPFLLRLTRQLSTFPYW